MITRSFADTFLQRVDVISDVFVVTKSCQETINVIQKIEK